MYNSTKQLAIYSSSQKLLSHSCFVYYQHFCVQTIIMSMLHTAGFTCD